MRKITLFAMLLVGILAGRAQSAIVGTYNGDMNLTHLTGAEATMEAQAVTISEVDGKFNVTFPSFAIMTGTELGEFVVEDVVVSDNGDGTFSLTKEPFTITPPPAPNGMTTSYGQCTLMGTVYDDSTAEFIVEVKQNPAMALTTAFFFGSSKLPYVGEYTGENILREFEEATGATVVMENFDSNEQMYIKVANGEAYDILVPSDYMIERLKNEGYLQKLDHTLLNCFSELDEDVFGIVAISDL